MPKYAHYTEDPGYARSVEYVKKYGDQMNFETQAERRDYERKVKANPGNVMGVPAFLPAIEIVSTPTGNEDAYERQQIADGNWARCEKCHRIYNTRHYGPHTCNEQAESK